MFIIVSLLFQSCLLFGKKKMAGIDEPAYKRGSEFSPLLPCVEKEGLKGIETSELQGIKVRSDENKPLGVHFIPFPFPVREMAYQPAGQQQQHVLCGGA